MQAKAKKKHLTSYLLIEWICHYRSLFLSFLNYLLLTST